MNRPFLLYQKRGLPRVWRWGASRLLLMGLCSLGLSQQVFAEDSPVDVTVVEQTNVAGVVTTLAEHIVATGTLYTTQEAPYYSGYIFTHWSISTAQSYSSRDPLGRTYDAAPFTVYEPTVMTAHYLLETVDSDQDGIADGHELYWYGDLSQDGDSDTDKDGYSFAQELREGTSPILVDRRYTGVRWSDSALHLYNPNRLQPYVIRSEPEGVLFETITDYVKAGTVLTTPTCDMYATYFAYWTVDGKRVADSTGRALESVTFAMPAEPIEVVAHTAADPLERAALYWYGLSVAPEDSDGDDCSFADEVAMGTNPHFADRRLKGGVMWADTPLHDYNAARLYSYTIKSDPENQLFATVIGYAEVGEEITTPACDRVATSFAYWTQDGDRVTDESGRSVDTVTFRMPDHETVLVAHTEADPARREMLYWYGSTGVDPACDTDGDGYTYEEEIARGTSPLLADRYLTGGVAWADSGTHGMNLQVYEQATGAVVGKLYQPLFTAPLMGNTDEAVDFGSPVTPVVVDLNGDGCFDIVVLCENGKRYVYLHTGTPENPSFAETAWDEAWTPLVAAAQVTAADLADCTFDEVLEDALSYTFGDENGDGLPDLLASDPEGRIWYYRNSSADGEASPQRFILQHKVWGGSHPGFAAGLKLAAVDWENDGDLDCLCGTAEGRLMLLNNPKGGRPVNLTASAGADSVSLRWEPSSQSRIRGYTVYRNDADGNPSRIATTEIPKWLDKPEDTSLAAYSVSSFSRFYRTGNSRPILVDSPRTDVVTAQPGKVHFAWRATPGMAGNDIRVDFTIANALNLAAKDLSLKVSYDPEALCPLAAETSGLTEHFTFVETKTESSWIISGTGGEIQAGSGIFLTFVFAIADPEKASETVVTVEEFTLKSVANLNVIPMFESKSETVTVDPETPQDDTYVAAGSLGDLDGNGRLAWDDVELFLKWKDFPADEIPEAVRRAGDFNGDGRMDNRDYGLMKEFYRVRERRCPSLRGWDKNHGYKGGAL